MGMLVRSYKKGDEVQIVRLLNICFGNWGSIQKWNACYLEHPNFDEKDIFVIEKDGEIIAHEALHFRDLVMSDGSVMSTVSLRDAAVHPDYRGQGLHSKLLVIMLEDAKSRGASLVFSWYLRDSGLYEHSKKIGFIEIKQPAAYMKVARPENVIRSGLLDFLHKSPNLKEKISRFGNDLCFSLGNVEFPLAELLGKYDQNTMLNEKKIKIVFKESSVPSLIKFRSMTGRQRLLSLASLLILRKVSIKFGSLAAFMTLVRKGSSIIGSL
jgi:N-acetylglutamate synthase-like GNAT family acetyltransferase